jgi:hypothetical protein
MDGIVIDGQGIAALCCAYLLGRVGFRLSLRRRPRPSVPAVMVSRATEELMAGVFQRADLFEGCRRIDRRIVVWGPRAEPVMLPHAAVVLAEETLLERIALKAQDASIGDSAWYTVFASRTLPEPAVERHFGSRCASAVAVELKAPETPACWIESLESGWLFLIPGWLIAVGSAPETLLAQSRLVADEVRGMGQQRAEFPAYPRIADPLCGPGWLACGTAAMAFDPICGDGTGNAVREAILAAAVIRAARRGEPVIDLLSHYGRRLMAGFQRHLELSLEFYRAGNSGPWWEAEIQALERGLAWCAGQLAGAPAYLYRLEDFDLVPATGSLSARTE